jgi:UDP-N-acetylmuramate: L-alanyl-gamma-D-glutamyl-meso-diaminopimelate ligase
LIDKLFTDKEQMKVHFIAIGGQVMHNLALSLKQKGADVSGSDDAIYEPSASQLKKHDLFPDTLGWSPERITTDLDAVIVGMHAKKDNPELLKAKELGLKMYSFPEYIFQSSQNKQRVVIAGSHGKTSITAMLMHVLKFHGREFDYVLGAYVKGFDTTVRLSDDANLILIEGDEYATSADDLRPKFLHYKHHICVVSGIAWDHANIYPKEEEYITQFQKLLALTPKAGSIIYYTKDKKLKDFVKKGTYEDANLLPYEAHSHSIKNGITTLKAKKGKVDVQIFGKHNMENLNAAKGVCLEIGITEEQFYEAIPSFNGADKRLELVSKNENTAIYTDFAHAPSKVRATIEALKVQFPKQKLVACFELHTFSSLNKDFLPQYKDTMKVADEAIVFFDPEKVASKGYQSLDTNEIIKAFNKKGLQVFTDKETLQNHLWSLNLDKKNLLMMSSGTFGGLDLKELSTKLCQA